MDNTNFFGKSVKELQLYLKDRWVIFSDIRKAELIELCVAAERLGITVDPDGLLEDREEILKLKLTTPKNEILPNPETVQGSQDLNILLPLAIFDIYNYLLTFEQYNHASLRNYQKMEAFGLFENGYVLNVECSILKNKFTSIKSNVKPRTNEKDPVSNLRYNKCWIVLNKTEDDSSKGRIFSAYCTYKGGIDGGCRHVVATLFEVCDYLQDRKKDSVTSGPCLWVKRARKTSDPVLVTDLDTCLTVNNADTVKPLDIYSPLPRNISLPKPEDLVQVISEIQPSACMLDVWQKRMHIQPEAPVIRTKTPLEKTTEFWTKHKSHSCSNSCYAEFIEHLNYTSEDIAAIEEDTRGQNSYANWKKFRSSLLTSSTFKNICHSTNFEKTAQALLDGPSFSEENIPAPILFGRRNETKAREMFVKSHRFTHKKCKVNVPGLVISSEYPMLATSPDGIIDFPKCGTFLVEIKYLFSYRKSHPSSALIASKVCERDDQDLTIKRSHQYNYQIQGQMGITGIRKCVLVGYTNKGIYLLILYLMKTCGKICWKN